MCPIYSSLADRIGHTPLMRLRRLEETLGLPVRLLGKLEGANPGGSAKDRVALFMLRQAEAQGLLAPGSVIIEPTSGNTGIGLAMVGCLRGYRVVIVMPDSMSPERRGVLAAYGAEVVLTPGAQGMAGAMARARELAEVTPNAWIPQQFCNPANPLAHYETTGPEIWRDTQGQVDLLVAGVGTGGTITGTGKYLREKNPALRVVAVEPADSPVLSGGQPGPHHIQGIGAGFLPEVLDREIYHQVIPVSTQAAVDTLRLLAKTEGLLCGISSGAALWATLELARQPEWEGKTLVTILPDTGERYLSTGLF